MAVSCRDGCRLVAGFVAGDFPCLLYTSNPVDLMFDALEAEKPNHFAVRQYKKYKLAAGKTAKSILISCGARLAVFDIAELREVTAYEMCIRDRRNAVERRMSESRVRENLMHGLMRGG